MIHIIHIHKRPAQQLKLMLWRPKELTTVQTDEKQSLKFQWVPVTNQLPLRIRQQEVRERLSCDESVERLLQKPQKKNQEEEATTIVNNYWC